MKSIFAPPFKSSLWMSLPRGIISEVSRAASGPLNSQKTTDNGRGGYGRTVYNRKRYMIAHLLQNGHGGPRPARAFPHIPSDDETEKLFMEEMERAMK